MYKPILCLDFDGVMHSYISGWLEVHIIPDPPVPGLFEFLRDAMAVFEVYVLSSRSKEPVGLKAMQDWLLKHHHEHYERNGWGIVLGDIKWPTEKPAAFVTLDDRAITFTGSWPDVKALREFKPWNKR